MTSPFRKLLEHYRSNARSQREKGTYFERLTKLWLKHAPTQAGRYTRVLTYADFARQRGESGTDTGIDLVAELAEDPGRWCAVQCKFYAEGYRIQRADIDGFLAASARAPFARRLFVDTTGVNWTDHAETTFRDQAIETQRVGLTELEDTFQLYEKDDLIAAELRDNSGRRTRQKALDIRVIIGNPPYSDGQDTANDNAANVA